MKVIFNKRKWNIGKLFAMVLSVGPQMIYLILSIKIQYLMLSETDDL